jgi:hypothetical protein
MRPERQPLIKTPRGHRRMLNSAAGLGTALPSLVAATAGSAFRAVAAEEGYVEASRGCQARARQQRRGASSRLRLCLAGSALAASAWLPVPPPASRCRGSSAKARVALVGAHRSAEPWQPGTAEGWLSHPSNGSSAKGCTVATAVSNPAQAALPWMLRSGSPAGPRPVDPWQPRHRLVCDAGLRLHGPGGAAL